ncbi:MAG: phosphate/phosphite/phosphonate ABC transporter substrate-binding protein [Anaerovibrio sp.]|uniref:substrate-binding domain-containing protein n=1 Tax=Anaerovibrio sp. TaxID=1872532 RepID=UPI0025EB20DE|nr:phosphate/phosphite/phosphonate ABC transporter substrate-binding protein [Anaerovibrio sp.]MCR5176609.1 phosphate/phosphite/phosphonate ABC transporter substrate-binding protein [Anaerovibrio sp.]
MKTLKIFRLGLLLLCVCLLFTGCESTQGYIDFSNMQAQSMDNNDDNMKQTAKGQPLRIAFASVLSPREARQYYQKVVDYVSAKTGRPTVLIQRKTYEELNMMLSGGECDIAFISTGAYASYHGMQSIDILTMAQTYGTVYYQALLIVPADSDITDFSQLRGKVMAFTDPISYSGRLAIDYKLLEEYNTIAEKFFQRCYYTYNHDKSLWAVANHLADGAGIDGQVYEYCLKNNPELAKKLRVIETMDPVPTGPVVIRSDLPADEKERLRELFINMNNDPNMQVAMARVMIDKFVPQIPHAYDELRSKYNRLAKLPGD